MRLRRVVISGFKTFARRSEVTLEPGITAIVGPNGSGKSNLVDAIRWALGETNARELRGARMDEVIYSGGSGRARMGFAEVELILDNEDGRLAVDDIEVSVSRRVARHGDSEFRLNGDRVRLRDVERVLGTTGLTQSGYAVVAQNDIDAIIEATPAQRRALVEQAAGVRSLRAACEDALGRVGQAEVTLRRFEDLLAETEPRLAELAVQAQLAREQQQLSEQLSGLRGSLAREAWRGARAQLRQASRRLDAAGQRLDAATTAEAAFATRLGAHRARLDQQRQAQGAAAHDLEEARLYAERAAGDQQRSLDRARAGVLARALAALELRAAGAEQEVAAAELSALLGSDGASTDAGTEIERRHADAERVRDATAEEHRTAEAGVGAAEAALRAAEQELAAADADLHRNAAQLRLFREATASLQERADAASAQVLGLERQEGQATLLRDGAAAAVTAAEGAAATAETETATARHAVEETQTALDEVRQAARAALARAAVLRGQVEGALGGPGAIAAAVSAGDLEARRLVDSFTIIDPDDGPAVEAALEAHLGAWIVVDVDDAAALLDVRSAREEVLAAGDEPVVSEAAPAGARAALTCIRAEPGAGKALAACLTGVWLVPDSVTARRAVSAADGGRAVLPDGTVVSAAGLRGGGRPGRTLELAADERAAAAIADEAIATERVAEDARSAATAQLARAEANRLLAGERVQAARIEVAEATARLEASIQALGGERRRLEEARAELGARDVERESLVGADVSAARRVAEADARVEGMRASAEEALRAASAARAAASVAAATVAELEVETARLAAAAVDRARRLETARAAVELTASRREAAEVRVLTAELDVLAALARGRTARDVVDRSGEAVAAALERLSAAAPDLAESERAVAALDAERSEVAVVLARAEDERAAAAGEVENATERVAELAEAVRGDDEDDGPEPQAGDADKAEREIVRLERRVAALGPVNALAPAEHERVAARVAVLRAGRDDLRNACTDIRAMAARLTGAIDSRFEAVFGAVSVHFHELFAELFPGGRATLRREEATAVDEPGQNSSVRAGVEILAQPPGKRLQPLSLFSGGERALTALAVILALQQVNPSPFYVFDEVDAPLDDSNVLRFSRLLKRLAASQQFIVVTHNHITMAAADALHGVTSDGDGVSSVISVRFDAESGETLAEGHVVGLRQSTIRAAV